MVGLTKYNFLKIIKKYKNSKNLNLKCLSVHIGSQITNHRPYVKMLKVIESMIKKSNHLNRLVTLSPLTEMARNFHLKNGAEEVQVNEETQNFEYKIIK